MKLYFEREDNDLKDKVCTDETFYSTLGYRAEWIQSGVNLSAVSNDWWIIIAFSVCDSQTSLRHYHCK